jgi:6-phosphogluconolactonase (cycloisomerase 2 family)
VLSQPAAPNGCISGNGASQDGAGMCLSVGTINDPVGISISPDDRFVYVTDVGNFSIHVLSRDSATGALTETQCLSDQASPPAGCASARVIGDAQSVVISPDGLHAYTTRFGTGLSVFDRDPATGALTQKPGSAGCISNSGNDDTGAATCTTGRVLFGAYSISIDPVGGHTLYVTAYNDKGIAIFHVGADGSLTQLPGAAGCVTLTGQDNTQSPTCTAGRALEKPYGVTISPDDRTLYATELTNGRVEGGVAEFSIDPSTGSLTQLPGTAGCLTVDGASGGVANACGVSTALGAAYQPIVSPDGRSVYIASEGGQSVTIFNVESAPTDATGVSTPVTAGAPVAVAAPVKLPVVLTGASQSHRRWHERKHGGTTFSFTLNQAARVTLTFTQRNHRRALGRLTIAGHAGKNQLAFNGRINRHTALKPGTYTVTITAGTSTRRLSFTVVK